MTKEIDLTRGQVALVEDWDYEWLNLGTWHLHPGTSNGRLYARGRPAEAKGRKQILMHRHILRAEQGEYVDHVNGDGLDNRRCNLRICTKSQNSANTGPYCTNTSGYHGVRFRDDRQKWQAEIWLNGKKHHLGLFVDAAEAVLAYNKAAIELYGEFAYQNKLPAGA